MLRASQTLTPNLQDSYDTIVRLAEGEKGVAWADQSNLSSDGLMDVSTSNFTQSQHALFDNLLVSASPRSRLSDAGGSLGNYNSPFPITTSLGILTTSNSVRNTPHVQNNITTPLSSSTVAGGNTSASTPRLQSSVVRPSSAAMYERRQQLQVSSNGKTEQNSSNSAFGVNSPFVRRNTVSAGGVKCETSIGGVRSVTIASSNAGPSNLATSASMSSSGGGAGNSTPVRVTTLAKTENLIQSASKLPRPTLDDIDMDSVLGTRFHSHYKDLGSDSSQGSTSMYSTQCVVTNRHMHAFNCSTQRGISMSARKHSDPLSNPGSPREVSHDELLRPKSANEVLQPQSSRFTTFTPIRTPGRSDAKVSNLQTPSFSSTLIRGGASSSQEGLSKGPVCTRTDSRYSTSLSEVSRNENGINNGPSPYLIPRSRNMTDFHSTSTAGQPAFSIPPPTTHTNTNITNSSNTQGYGYASFPSQITPGSSSLQLPTARSQSPSQQSQSLSISSDSSTNCVVDMNMSSKPRPAFQTSQNKSSVLSLPSGNNSQALSMPQNGSVRTAVLPTRNFCLFEDNFVSPRTFSGVPKTPTGATTTAATTPLSSNLSRPSPLHRQFPPSVSSRSNYISTSFHDGLNKMQSPVTTSTNNYSNALSSNNLSNPYSANVCSNLHRGAKSAPHSMTSRFHSGMVPPQSPGVMANKTYAPSVSAPMQYQMQSSPPHESYSGDSMPDSTDHIYQTIEAPPPLPPPRSRNIYVPRPQNTGHTSFSRTVQSSSADVIDPGYANRLIRPYTVGGVDNYKKSGHVQPSANLNETFTIEPSAGDQVSPYQRHKFIRPSTAPDRDGGHLGGSNSGGKSSNPYVQHPPRHHQQHSHASHMHGLERKLPSYLQMTKSAASKRVPR